ncbi:sulfite exporter TauE/SafE family protein [Ostreibacterium oceani]|uniref:Probable membrane transporter protein n=1 Tax=Ostreibacterium oceani TaxID=2654998 RepID=A0A6N7EW54_9GAMM|nr:sulfite exporter TauE/SafE family protein [Ostreibacterium oceani]MPV86732.1 TSUP family transporter [Ostreibacterium oceani]
MIDALPVWQIALVLLIFIWSGFVRTALGFGGAALSLPLFLLIIDNPVEIIPIIGLHLLLSAGISLVSSYQHIDWRYLGKTLIVILPFKIIGVIGLLNLPATVLNISVYLITLAYAISYLMKTTPRIRVPGLDYALLAGGGYISGTSLIGAPLIIAVFAKSLPPIRLRATLFCLWILLVLIKMLGFIVTATPLNVNWALYTLPFMAIGHILGEKAHKKILQVDKAKFLRIIGLGLASICLIGLARTLYVSIG